jgi:hypothetical protein
MTDPLSTLRTAYPSHNWKRDGACLVGYVPVGKIRVPISVIDEDDGWFDAEVFTEKSRRGLGTTAVNAVRIALRRAGLT